MNLEVLFASSNLTGNDTLRHIATSHADKTMQNHVRADGLHLVTLSSTIEADLKSTGSSFHVVEYNETTGEVIKQRTAQGYADNRYAVFNQEATGDVLTKLLQYLVSWAELGDLRFCNE